MEIPVVKFFICGQIGRFLTHSYIGSVNFNYMFLRDKHLHHGFKFQIHIFKRNLNYIYTKIVVA